MGFCLGFGNFRPEFGPEPGFQNRRCGPGFSGFYETGFPGLSSFCQKPGFGPCFGNFRPEFGPELLNNSLHRGQGFVSFRQGFGPDFYNFLLAFGPDQSFGNFRDSGIYRPLAFTVRARA